jgi:hypothetical protein
MNSVQRKLEAEVELCGRRVGFRYEEVITAVYQTLYMPSSSSVIEQPMSSVQTPNSTFGGLRACRNPSVHLHLFLTSTVFNLCSTLSCMMRSVSDGEWPSSGRSPPDCCKEAGLLCQPTKRAARWLMARDDLESVKHASSRMLMVEGRRW